MQAIFPLLQFVGAVALLILVHEIGHFIGAKLGGIPIKELAIGFPPRVAKLFTAGGTDFTLNLIPLGGYVLPEGENDPDVEGGFASSSPWARLLMLVSGPLANILLALVLFALIFLQLGRPDYETVQIMEVAPGSPAAEAGLMQGDIVLEINGEEIDSTLELRETIYANLGAAVTLVYERDGASATTQLVPRDPPPEEGAIGIAMGNPSIAIGGLEALYYGGEAIINQVDALVSLPGRMLSGAVGAEEGRLVGYKGMYDLYTEVREADVEAPEAGLPSGINTMAFFASISVSLALLNLLPIPALDGGRILFTLPEIIIGRRIPPAYENVINIVGLALLLMIVIYVNVQDFVNPISVP